MGLKEGFAPLPVPIKVIKKPRLVRIDSDIYLEIKKIAKKNDRSIPKQINRFLRKIIIANAYEEKNI